MAETEPTITFSHKEVATLLIKDKGIHEGNWGIHLELALMGGMFPLPTSSDTLAVLPGGVLAVAKIGIHKFPQPNPLTVDAAVVNPARCRVST